MNYNQLNDRFPFLKEIDSNRREQFYRYFKNAPQWLLENISVEKIEKGRIFIREGNPVDAIYFIGDGIIKATDYRIYGIQFDFILFTDVYAFGGMEVIMELEKYKTSMQTVTDCIVLKIPKSKFSQWMKTDIEALRYESKLMGEYLLEQARSVRTFLFLQGADRVMMLFMNRYKKFSVNGILKIQNDRQELSDYTGLSVKTITRSVKKLEEEGLVKKTGNQILIDNVQYKQMKRKMSEIFSEEE